MDDAAAHPATHATETERRWAAAPPPHERSTDWTRVAHVWLIVLALVVLSISLLTALIAANQAVTIWLQPQYAPFVRTLGALLVAAAALYVVVRLTRRG